MLLMLDITPVKIAEYSNKLLENLSPKTVNTILTVLHMIFNYANEKMQENIIWEMVRTAGSSSSPTTEIETT